jgi:hypothetical protein
MPFNQISTSVTILSNLKGFIGVSLTETDTYSLPAIASGSTVEIANAYFQATEDITPAASTWTAITTGLTAYVQLTPAGTAGSQIVTATWTDTEPTWRDDAQGWYSSAGSIIRYVASAQKIDGTNAAFKTVMSPLFVNSDSIDVYDLDGIGATSAPTYLGSSRERSAIFRIGEWNMDATATIIFRFQCPFSNNLAADQSVMLVAANAFVRGDSGTFYYPIDWQAGGAVYGNVASAANPYVKVVLYREAGGVFDNSSYDGTASTVLNRGFVKLTYIDTNF